MMVKYELNLRDFKAWSGAVSTLDRILNEGKEEEFVWILEDIFLEGATETELNDYLWFDSEDIFEMLGIEEDEEEEGEEEY